MRKIKFRAWDTERKIFIPQGEIIFRDYGETEIEVYPNDQSYIGDSCHNGEPQRGRFVVSQFTGLKDKNGKEIYEGDIVKWGHVKGGEENPIRIAVVRINPDLRFVILRKDFQGSLGQDKVFKFGNFIYTDTEKWLEIIGNEFENPELLQEVEKGMKENKNA